MLNVTVNFNAAIYAIFNPPCCTSWLFVVIAQLAEPISFKVNFGTKSVLAGLFLVGNRNMAPCFATISENTLYDGNELVILVVRKARFAAFSLALTTRPRRRISRLRWIRVSHDAEMFVWLRCMKKLVLTKVGVENRFGQKMPSLDMSTF